MDFQSINNWIQSISGLAILTGLLFVVLELEQNREAMGAHLSNDGYQMLTQTQASLLGENPVQVLAKACDEPESLTTADFILLDRYYFQLVQTAISRLKHLGSRGSSFYPPDYWKTVVGPWRHIFSTTVGREWWRTSVFDQEIRALGDEVLSTWPEHNLGIGQPNACDFSEWKSAIRSSIGAPAKGITEKG